MSSDAALERELRARPVRNIFERGFSLDETCLRRSVGEPQRQ